MNDGAKVSSEALEAFAGDLSSFIAHMRQFRGDLNVSLGRLGQSFQDDHYKEFVDDFRRFMAKTESFDAEAASAVVMLRKDVERVRAYERIKVGG